MSELELVRALEPNRPGQVQELYRRGDDYIVVSTIPDIVGADLTTDQRTMIQIGGILGCATQGEETMAFQADERGEVTNWTEMAVANGPDSRARVLDMLAPTLRTGGKPT